MDLYRKKDDLLITLRCCLSKPQSKRKGETCSIRKLLHFHRICGEKRSAVCTCKGGVICGTNDMGGVVFLKSLLFI